MRRVLGYARVSSELQARGSSLGDQQEAIRAHAKSLKLTVMTFYVEAESAIHEKIERREQIQALLRDVREQDLVLCDKLDRWSRDTEFTLRSVREILAKGAAFYAVGDACDPSSRDGEMMLTLRAMIAREEHKRIRERTVGTRMLLRDKGYYVEGSPPLGYRRAHPRGYKGAEKNILVIVPEEAALVRRIFKMYVGGRSMREIAERLELKLDRVKDVLERRVYLGEIRNTRGEWMRGKHEPIIDAATYARAREIIRERTLGGPRPRSAPSRTDEWILRDVARCALCGAKMTSSYGGSGQVYYRCSKRCTSSYIEVHGVEEAAAPLVLDQLACLRDELGKAPQPEPRTEGIAERREKIARRRAKHLEAHAADLMTLDELRAALAKLDEERLRLDAQTTPGPLADATYRESVLRHVIGLHMAWERADGLQRRAIVNRLALDIGIATGRSPAPRWRPAKELELSELAALLTRALSRSRRGAW